MDTKHTSPSVSGRVQDVLTSGESAAGRGVARAAVTDRQPVLTGEEDSGLMKLPLRSGPASVRSGSTRLGWSGSDSPVRGYPAPAAEKAQLDEASLRQSAAKPSC